MVSKALNLGLRGFQAFCVFIVLALIGNMIASSHGSPAIVNFDMFVAVFALLSLIYLVLATINDAFVFNPLIILGLDLLNVLWLFCGAVATGAILGVHSCDDHNYLKHNSITRNSSKFCHEAQAADAFLFFALFAFIATTVFTALRSRGSVNMRSNPSMSQVSGSV